MFLKIFRACGGLKFWGRFSNNLLSDIASAFIYALDALGVQIHVDVAQAGLHAFVRVHELDDTLHAIVEGIRAFVPGLLRGVIVLE